ncbi:MAG: ABC transporter permease [Eubacteriales bacterium]|nr:ABC transporter permease [Eubacteriales bacterium]
MNIRFRKRTYVSPLRRILTPVVSVLAAMVFCGVFLALLGHDPLAVYAKMARTVGSRSGVTRSIQAGIPLMLTGLAVSFGYRMNLNNIGADGQYALGALFCAGFALYGPVMPPVFKIICMFLMAMLGGAAAALIAAVPKARWDVNETILTMMLNYVFLYAMDYLMSGPWKEPGQMVAQTKTIKEKYWLPNLGSSGINSVLLIVIALAVVMFFFHTRTVWGYRMEVIRHSPRAAQYAGMNVPVCTLLVLCASGAVAGLAGFAQVAGIIHRVQANLPNGAGYTGIVIAFLAGLNPLAVPLVGFLFGALQISAVAVQLTGVPSQVATMIQGSIMLFVVAGEFFIRYEPVRTGAAKKEE